MVLIGYLGDHMDKYLFLALIIFLAGYCIHHYIYQRGFKKGSAVEQNKWKPIVIKADEAEILRVVINRVITTYVDRCWELDRVAYDKISTIESVLNENHDIFSKYSRYIRKLPFGFEILVGENMYSVTEDGNN